MNYMLIKKVLWHALLLEKMHLALALTFATDQKGTFLVPIKLGISKDLRIFLPLQIKINTFKWTLYCGYWHTCFFISYSLPDNYLLFCLPSLITDIELSVFANTIASIKKNSTCVLTFIQVDLQLSGNVGNEISSNIRNECSKCHFKHPQTKENGCPIILLHNVYGRQRRNQETSENEKNGTWYFMKENCLDIHYF